MRASPSPVAGRHWPTARPGASPARFELNARPARDDEDDDEGVIEMLEHAHVHTVTKIREMRRELNARAEALNAMGPQLDALGPQLDALGPQLDAPRSSRDASHREPGRVSALLARYEREIGGLREEVETLRSAAKPPRPTPAPRRRGTRRRPRPNRTVATTTTTTTTTVGSTPPPSAAKRPAADPPETRARVGGDDGRLNEAERRTAPAPVEPTPGVARGVGSLADDDTRRRRRRR